jgi:uroporphyrinogen III methyltransferase / synthase
VTVYLVGAGPGDPGLLTVRGADVLARADVVVFDRLSVGSLLGLSPSSAERIAVGKAPGHATMAQDDINALLVEHGRAGRRVVRLKGGDPFVFARGGEEAQALLDAGVPFEIVPGITSAIAVPAYAGIPLTMRHSSTLFTVITGHEDPDKGDEIDWRTVAKLGGTIVVLMGIGRLAKIVDRLRAGGLAADTPVAAIRWGTRPEQSTVRATLATILDHSDELESPSTIVIGKVAAMNLDWFESRPLFARKIVVVRSVEQASQLAEALRAEGAEPIEVPVFEIADPDDGGVALREAAAHVRDYAWVIFTSTNSVNRFFDCVHDARDLGGVRVAAIGTATADALRARNVVADLVPELFVAESLLAEFPRPAGAGLDRVLLPRAAVARDVLPNGLRGQGWIVDVVDAYRSEAVVVADADGERAAAADMVAFTSASTVDRFVDAIGVERVPPIVACIGPITADAARAHGLDVDVEAAAHTIPGLVAAIVDHVRR